MGQQVGQGITPHLVVEVSQEMAMPGKNANKAVCTLWLKAGMGVNDGVLV